jgi:hypothetical protein
MVIAVAILLVLALPSAVSAPTMGRAAPQITTGSEFSSNNGFTSSASVPSFQAGPASATFGIDSSQTISNFHSLAFAGLLALIAAAVASCLAYVASRRI